MSIVKNHLFSLSPGFSIKGICKLSLITMAISPIISQNVFAGGEGQGVHVVNWYHILVSKLLLAFYPDLSAAELLSKADFWSPVFASLFGVFLLLLISILSGFAFMKPEKMSNEELLPPSKFGLRAFVELCWDVVFSTLESTLGEKKWQKFVPVLGSIFFLLIVINLSGVVPGFEPATVQMSFSFAAAIFVFIYFNYYGLKESGFDYIKHLFGPVIWMAPLLFIIEVVSIFSRPLSLSLRITGNITGDHFVFSIFSGLLRDLSIPFLPIPAIFIAFGTFVACLQAFIFMTLSAVYIKLALDAKSD
ncbi:MAG: F0F1 ATP synthase subunit A, partial [Silvanigrellaceae bacterium]|nr:F0F1 ATP synthase subunit A [Silvanigrellaceae bacterium]